MQVRANGIAIEVDDQGPRDAEPLLLIMGLGMQLIAWPDALVQRLVDQGFRVLRMDNRDAGLSQGFDAAGLPRLGWIGLRYALHLRVPAPYRLADMARDATGVLDALGIAQAHVCGASMGGMIAQHLAASAPSRVRSLTLMMTSSGSRRLPQPGWAVRRALMSRPRSAQADDVVAHLEGILRLIGSPAYPSDAQDLRHRLQRSVTRAWRPAGTLRQLVAVVADGDRSALLGRIVAPTSVIHGVDDPLVPVGAGRDLVARIAGAQGDFVPGMGHDLPDALLPRFADTIVRTARRAGGG